MNSNELNEAARFYAPTSERLQKAFVFGYQNGKAAPGMSRWEREAATIGARRAELERRNASNPALAALRYHCSKGEPIVAVTE